MPDFPDPAPVQVLALEANRFDPETPWSVPLKAKVRIYFQFLPHEDVPAVIAQIKASFRRFCDSDPFLPAYAPEWRDITAPPLLGHELDAGHEWVQCMARSATRPCCGVPCAHRPPSSPVTRFCNRTCSESRRWSSARAERGRTIRTSMSQ